MIPWIKSLLFNEGLFIGCLRAVLIALGTAAEGGYLPIPERFRFIGIFLAAIAVFIRAGDRNPEPTS